MKGQGFGGFRALPEEPWGSPTPRTACTLELPWAEKGEYVRYGLPAALLGEVATAPVSSPGPHTGKSTSFSSLIRFPTTRESKGPEHVFLFIPKVSKGLVGRL